MKGLRFEPLSDFRIPSVLAIESEANGAPWSEKSFQNELINPQSLFRVAVMGGEVIGYGGLWLCVDEAHVTNVAVRLADRRKGVGRAIMVELLRAAKELGMTCSTLEVRQSNTAAIAMYEELGFQQVAVRPRYYPDNQESAIVMWLYELDGRES